MSMIPVETEPAIWLPGHDYQPSEERSLIRALRGSPGVISWDDFTATPGPGTWQLTIGPGRAVIDGTVTPWLQGTYIVYSPSSRVISVPPSLPNQDRFYAVILHVLDQENSTEEGFGWVREVWPRTPQPGIPQLPPNSLAIYGLRVQAGSTGITGADFFPAIWPRPGDFRRPGGPTLMHMFANTSHNLTGGMNNQLQMFNLQIPAGWEHLALWPFDVVMSTHITCEGFNVQNELLTFTYTRRPGVTRQYRLNNHIGGQWGHASWQDFQLFEQGTPPYWNLTVQASGSTQWGINVESRTKLYPRSVTTNRTITMTGPPQW